MIFGLPDFINGLAIGWIAYDITHGRFASIDAVLAVCIVTRVTVLLLEFRLRRLSAENRSSGASPSARERLRR